jgi:hypothetical protein
MNKRGQVENIIAILTFSVFFLLGWFILGKMELDSGFISNILNNAVSSVSGIDNVPFVLKLIVPTTFIVSFVFFIIYIRGAISEI